MQKHSKKAFTLVELIVVITILAILGTIAFIALQGYSKSARDSKRVSDIQNIKKSLELFSINTGKYPVPDEGYDAKYADINDDIIWTQGVLGETVQTNLSKNLNSVPLDPLTELEYTYSITNKKTEYEVLSIYESDLISYNNILNQAQAETLYPKIEGTYNGVVVITSKYIIPTPSIINSEINGSGIILNDYNITSQITTGGNNLLANGTTTSSTKQLNNFTLEAFTGGINDLSATGAKLLLGNNIIEAYSGTILAEEAFYKTILSEDPIVMVDQVVFNEITVITDWRSVDSNCDIPDIVIGNQIWAGCNSTLGDGLDFGQLISDAGTNNYNGSIGNCYTNYDTIIDTSGCIIGDIIMKSNQKANNWFTGNNVYGDSEFNNIWGKFYAWYYGQNLNGINLDNNNDGVIDNQEDDEVCGKGYHIPTDIEWAELEQALGCSAGEALRSGWGCNGLGWLNHSSKNNENNIAEALKIPLAGYYHGTQHNVYRGGRAFLWTSTSFDTTSAYPRYLYNYKTTVFRLPLDKNHAYNVRCKKD